MRKILIFVLAAVLINLTACGSYTGNVIPQTGPSMEGIYDSMGETTSTKSNVEVQADSLATIREHVGEHSMAATASLAATTKSRAITQEFRKLPNPELTLYVYPHLAGTEQIPVPGYYTVFDAYEHNHYALPDEMPKG